MIHVYWTPHYVLYVMFLFLTTWTISFGWSLLCSMICKLSRIYLPLPRISPFAFHRPLPLSLEHFQLLKVVLCWLSPVITLAHTLISVEFEFFKLRKINLLVHCNELQLWPCRVNDVRNQTAIMQEFASWLLLWWNRYVTFEYFTVSILFKVGI